MASQLDPISSRAYTQSAVEEFQQQGDTTHVLRDLGNAYARMGSAAKTRELIMKLRERVEQTNVG